MSFKTTRKTAALVKIEGVYGTDSIPTGAANAIEISEPAITPLAGGTVKHDYLRPELGASPSNHVNVHVTVSFAVAIAGSGVLGTAPAYGPLLRMCAMVETINAGVSVEYDPTSSGNPESGSIYFFKDGTKHALLGARGNVTLMFPPNDIPHYKFDFVGLFVAPAANANPTVDFSAFLTPLDVSSANTPTFTLHGYAAVLESLELNIGNAVTARDRVNSNQVLRTDRQGAGSVSFESPALGTKDFFAIAIAETQGVLQLVHGPTATNIVQIDAPKVQLLEPTYGDNDSLELLQMGLSLIPNTGDDEIKITIK